MFAAQQLELPVSLAMAEARLASLAQEGGLRRASLQSFDGGVEHLLRTGPIPKLVRIRFLAPVYRDDEMSLGLRWEATGVAGVLFPVLDADITVTRSGEQTTTLALVGSYRPPLGALGATLDKAILNQVAAATIRALLRDVADTITRSGKDEGRDDDDADADPRRHRDA
jgi:hypothetical protein